MSLKILFWTIVAAVIIQNLAPFHGDPGKANRIYLFHIRLDYLLHFFMFFGLSILFWLAYYDGNARNNKYRFFFPWFILVLAIITELLQWPIAYRAFNPKDMLANLLGVLVSIPVVFFTRLLVGDRR